MKGEAPGRRLLLLFGSGTDSERSGTLAAESSLLGSLLRDTTVPVEVSALSLGLSRAISGTTEHVRLEESLPGPADRILSAFGAYALRTRLAGFPLGRLLNTLGPLDPGRVFWRAVKRNPEAIRLLKSANAVVATDLTGAKTAWIAVHRGWVDDAFYDHRSASVGISWQLPSVTGNPSS